MAKRIIIISILGILAVGCQLGAAVSQELVNIYQQEYAGRTAYLRVNVYQDPYVVSITSDNFRRPTGVRREALFLAGAPVRISNVRFGNQEVVFAITSSNAARGARIKFSFEEPLDPEFSLSSIFEQAVQSVFNSKARFGSSRPEEEPLPETEEPPDEPETEAEEPDEPEPDFRLLVEPGGRELPGDGKTVTTIIISARDADGQLITKQKGMVDVRINAGRLSSNQVYLSGGIARTRLQAPILDDQSEVMRRMVQLTYMVTRKLLGSGPKADIQAVARESATGLPSTAALSTVKGDKPYVFIVAECNGVKGKARIKLTPAKSPVIAIAPGIYKGDDITGSSSWTFDTQTMILTQDGSRDQIPVAFNGENGLGAYGVDIGGMGTSIVPLSSDSFYLFAPPILFYRVQAAAVETEQAPVTIKPTPIVSLTARKNPLAADGKSSTEVLFAYKDDKGRPVKGIKLTWRIGPRMKTAEKGRLLQADGETRADGTARAVFQTPRMNARNMQQTGSIKNRDIIVDYAAKEDSGRVFCSIGLLKAASVCLVVEKPGIQRSVLPLAIGSLNGTIEGRILLRPVRFLPAGRGTSIPLNDARVFLEGDERILKDAAVDKVSTDEDGNFTLSMHMKNWPNWDKKLKRPFVVSPSSRFINLQHNAQLHLGQYKAPQELHFRGMLFIHSAQLKLAELEFDEAEGLMNKVELFGWMLLVLRDTRKDAIDAGNEFMDNAWACLKSVAALFYTDSKLEKYFNKKIKILGQKTGFRNLKAIKTRWEKKWSSPTSMPGKIYRWLLRAFYRNPPIISPEKNLQVRGVGRSVLNELLIPTILKQLSDFLGKYMPNMPKPDIKGLINTKLLVPYDEIANKCLLLFLENKDYLRIRKNTIPAYAKLKVRHASLAKEFHRVTEWRIALTYFQTFVDTTSECSQIALKIIGAAMLQPQLIEYAKKLQKIQNALDSAMAGARFIDECYRFSGILEKTLTIVVTTTGELQGAAIQLSTLQQDSNHQPRILYAGFLTGNNSSDDLHTLELADNIEWDLLEIKNDRLPKEALAYLAEIDEVLALWEMETAPKLLALQCINAGQTKALVDILDSWDTRQRSLRFLTLSAGERPLSNNEKQRWEDAVDALREETGRLQSSIDDTCDAIEDLPTSLEVALLEEMSRASSKKTTSMLPSWIWLVLIGCAVFCFLSVVLMVVIKHRGGRRRQAAHAIIHTHQVEGKPTTRAAPPQSTHPTTHPQSSALKSAPVSSPPNKTEEVTSSQIQPKSQVSQPVASAWLLDHTNRHHPISAKCTTIGSTPNNRISLGVRGISRHHARIWQTDDGQFWIEDLNSTNGVFMDNQRITKAWLTPNAVLTLGDWRARFIMNTSAKS